MTDVDATTTETAPAGADANGEQPDVTPEDMISRGKGMKLDAIEEGSAAAAAVEAFKDLVARHKEAEAAEEDLKDQRNQAIYDLKANHNVGFTAIAELIGGTASLALYLYERAQGKSAKQIREESQRSNAAKKQFLESKPSSGRKQTPEEKAFRKQQREALKAFLAEQQAAGADVEPLEPDDDDDDE